MEQSREGGLTEELPTNLPKKFRVWWRLLAARLGSAGVSAAHLYLSAYPDTSSHMLEWTKVSPEDKRLICRAFEAVGLGSHLPQDATATSSGALGGAVPGGSGECGAGAGELWSESASKGGGGAGVDGGGRPLASEESVGVGCEGSSGWCAGDRVEGAQGTGDDSEHSTGLGNLLSTSTELLFGSLMENSTLAGSWGGRAEVASGSPAEEVSGASLMAPVRAESVEALHTPPPQPQPPPSQKSDWWHDFLETLPRPPTPQNQPPLPSASDEQRFLDFFESLPRSPVPPQHKPEPPATQASFYPRYERDHFDDLLATLPAVTAEASAQRHQPVAPTSSVPALRPSNAQQPWPDPRPTSDDAETPPDLLGPFSPRERPPRRRLPMARILKSSGMVGTSGVFGVSTRGSFGGSVGSAGRRNDSIGYVRAPKVAKVPAPQRNYARHTLPPYPRPRHQSNLRLIAPQPQPAPMLTLLPMPVLAPQAPRPSFSTLPVLIATPPPGYVYPPPSLPPFIGGWGQF